jgi:protocatechuate 3,4-dioxygenase beta subunit
LKLLVILFSLILVATAAAAQTNPPEQASAPSIQGKVLQDPDEQPVRKANVQLNGRKGPGEANYSAVSDAAGQFKIDDAQPGQYDVVVERPGFVQSVTGGRRISISVQAGSGKNDLILHMQPAAVITGKIVDLDGDPMRDVSVSAIKTGQAGERRNPHSFGSGATNDLGEFRISDLQPGRYKITASPPQGSHPPASKENGDEKDQSIYLATHYPGVLDEGQAVPLEIHAGAEARINLSILTGRAYRVSGTVAGVPGKGRMTQVQVMLEAKGSGGSQMASQELGEGGRFEFTNVLPGSYVATLIVATFEGGQPAMQMLRLSQLIEVGNANVEGLRLQPEASGQVRGKFRLDTGEKFDWTQLSVVLMPAEENGAEVAFRGIGIPTMSSVNIDGAFEIKNVPGGNYQVLVEATSKGLRDYITESVNLEGRDVADSGFSVLPETNLDVVISAKGASIAGTVVDDKGQPVANAIVVDVPSAEHRMRMDLYQRDTTDENGHFNLRGLNPGTCSVFAFEELQEDVRQAGFLKSYEKRGETVQLDEGTRKNLVLKLIACDGEAP